MKENKDQKQTNISKSIKESMKEYELYLKQITPKKDTRKK